MSQPFVLGDTEGRHESSDDDMMYESDFEHFGSTNGDSQADSINYWFGKIYFAYRLSRRITQRASSNASSSDLDLALMQELTEYPYAGRLAKARQHGPPPIVNAEQTTTSNKAFREFVITVGALARLEDSESQESLARLMLDENVSPILRRSPCSDPVASEQPQRNTLGTCPPQGTPELAQYTMMLKEYGDHSGEVPVYNDEQLSLHPTLFKVSVRVAQRTFEGKSSTKKQAKHLASQQACDFLELKP